MIIDGQVVIIDWDDPCAAFVILRRLYLDQQVSGGVKRVRIRTDRTDREVEYQPGGTGLKDIMRQLEYECAIVRGVPPRRVTIAG